MAQESIKVVVGEGTTKAKGPQGRKPNPPGICDLYVKVREGTRDMLAPVSNLTKTQRAAELARQGLSDEEIQAALAVKATEGPSAAQIVSNLVEVVVRGDVAPMPQVVSLLESLGKRAKAAKAASAS